MVAVSSEERVTAERAQGIVLVTPFLLNHVTALEHPAVQAVPLRWPDVKRAAALLQQIIIYNYIVKEIPGVLIAESAVAGLVHGPHGIEIPPRLHLGDFLLCAERLGKYGNIDTAPLKTTLLEGGETTEETVTTPRYLNSYQMVFDKTAFAYDYGFGGMMVWHYACDAKADTGLSLFEAMAEAVLSRQP